MLSLTHTCTHTHCCEQGFVLVYEVTNKDSYDSVTSLRQKIAQRNKDVSDSFYCVSFTFEGSCHSIDYSGCTGEQGRPQFKSGC